METYESEDSLFVAPVLLDREEEVVVRHLIIGVSGLSSATVMAWCRCDVRGWPSTRQAQHSETRHHF